jgi:hypothetical protein
LPSDEFITITGNKVKILSAATGAVIRTTTLAQVAPEWSQPAIDPTGRTAYVTVTLDVSCSSAEVVAIDLRSGRNHVVASSASNPSVSADGTRLAYIDYSGTGCSAGRVTVEDLRSGTRQFWQIAAPPPGPTRSAQTLTSLQWAPDSRHLVIGSDFGLFSGIQILDTTHPVSSANPETVGGHPNTHGVPGGRFTDPALEPDGTIVALLPFCWGGMACPTQTQIGTGIVTVDRATGQIASTLLAPQADPGNQLSNLIVDPSGQRLAAEGGLGAATTLYEISAGQLRPVAQNVGSVAWLPRSADATG